MARDVPRGAAARRYLPGHGIHWQTGGFAAKLRGMLYPTPERLRQFLRDEVQQRREEGCDVAPCAADLEEARDPAALLALYDRLTRLAPRPDFPYDEPSDWPAIRAACPAASLPRLPPVRHLEDQVYGAWLGRCAGMMLGKPFECQPFGNIRGALRNYLELAGDYPLSDYARHDPAACRAVGRAALPWPTCQRGAIRHVEPDDDIHYTIMGLELLERHGRAFTTADVVHWWTHQLPATAVFTAEEAVYRNLMLLGRQYEPQLLTPDEWDHVRAWLNPYREWIGAQIRADGWALACPGAPALAAELAYRDACLAHVKNGIYGELFCAAMIAAALTGAAPRTVVAAGLQQIPQRSRLAGAIRATLARCAAVGDDPARFAELIDWLWDTLGHYHPIHTINNAAAVTAAIVLGGDDFERAITIAVMCGWDTDCNGATAGCIAGARLGAARLPAKWIAPLNDTLRVAVPGFNPASIRACARRHVAVADGLWR